eukprot:418211_1
MEVEINGILKIQWTMSIGIFFDIKNYANILDGHLIHSRVDYMGCGMEKKVIYGNTIKIHGFIAKIKQISGSTNLPLTAAQHEQNITPQDTIKHISHIKKQISGHKKTNIRTRNIFIFIESYVDDILYCGMFKVVYMH